MATGNNTDNPDIVDLQKYLSNPFSNGNGDGSPVFQRGDNSISTSTTPAYPSPGILQQRTIQNPEDISQRSNSQHLQQQQQLLLANMLYMGMLQRGQQQQQQQQQQQLQYAYQQQQQQQQQNILNAQRNNINNNGEGGNKVGFGNGTQETVVAQHEEQDTRKLNNYPSGVNSNQHILRQQLQQYLAPNSLQSTIDLLRLQQKKNATQMLHHPQPQIQPGFIGSNSQRINNDQIIGHHQQQQITLAQQANLINPHFQQHVPQQNMMVSPNTEITNKQTLLLDEAEFQSQQMQGMPDLNQYNQEIEQQIYEDDASTALSPEESLMRQKEEQSKQTEVKKQKAPVQPKTSLPIRKDDEKEKPKTEILAEKVNHDAGLFFTNFPPIPEKLELGQLVINENNEIGLIYKITSRTYTFCTNTTPETYQVQIDRKIASDKLRFCNLSFEYMCKQYLHCDYDELKIKNKMTKAQKYKNKLTYIEALNVQAKFQIEYDKCEDHSGMRSWLYYLVKVTFYEPYVRMNIIMYDESEIKEWRDKFSNKLIKLGQGPLVIYNTWLLNKLVEYAQFFKVHIKSLPPPPKFETTYNDIIEKKGKKKKDASKDGSNVDSLYSLGSNSSSSLKKRGRKHVDEGEDNTEKDHRKRMIIEEMVSLGQKALAKMTRKNKKARSDNNSNCTSEIDKTILDLVEYTSKNLPELMYPAKKIV